MAAKPTLLRRIAPVALKGLWTAFVICTPLLGVWLSASLAAYLNGPMWVIWLVGLLLFPGLPAAWEGLALFLRHRRERKRGFAKKRFLTWYDRMILRTLAINVAFLAIVLTAYPQDGFAALATRGDWMLMDSEAPWAESTRDRLFAAAEGLEWLYDATSDDPYERFRPEESKDVEPVPPSTSSRTWKPLPDAPTPAPSGSSTPSGDDAPDEPSPPKPPALAEQPWPTEAVPHPLVAEIPEEAEASIESIARWIAEREKRPLYRVKALHDYVADRIAYDVPALSMARIPSQEPSKVLRERKGVCSGYSLLMVALGKITGDRIVYVGGDARDLGGSVDGRGHAWNAVEIGGRWYLFDATWNAGFVNGDTFTKRYTTAYLFTPPEIFISDHWPDDEKWQLLEEPLSRGAFMRQPVLRPSFFAHGLRLIRPKRSQVTVSEAADLVIDNPFQRHILARLRPKGVTQGGERCEVTPGKRTEVHCPIGAPGTYQVWMFASRRRSGSFPFVGQLEVNHR
jgi:hypothetical protein